MIAAVFPGQGSQKPGMGLDLAEQFPNAATVFETVGRALNLDVRELCWNTDEETLRQTHNAQIALYTVSLAAFRAARIAVKATAGHSVGEYAALVAAGVISLEDGALLVRRRGELMAEAGETSPGTMAAILGLDKGPLAEICASIEGIVVVANDNCPGQIVISGTTEAVEAAGEQAIAHGAKRVLPLNVSGAFHSPLMAKPARQMGDLLRETLFLPSEIPVYSNVTSYRINDPTEWDEMLQLQLLSAVRWTESVQNMISSGVTTFVEFGSGNVLGGLIGRIDKSVTVLKVNDSATLAQTRDALV